MTNARVIAADARFTANPSLTELFVTTSAECFRNSGHASARQKDINGVRSDVARITPDHVELYDDLNEAANSGDCDTALENSELEDSFALALTDARKDELSESDHVTSALAWIATAIDVTALELLQDRETNEDVLDAIAARIIALS